MKPLKCGSCNACCKWHGDKAIRPVLQDVEVAKYRHTETNIGHFVLEANKWGECVYLGQEGCTIYNDRPSQCRAFDCRTLYNEMKNKTFINVIMMGKIKS